MKRWRTKVASMLAGLLLLMQFGGYIVAAEPDDPAAAAGDGQRITIVHVNDMHSRVEESGSSIGYARLSSFIKDLKASNPNTLVLDAGDTLHGQTIANLVRGESIVRIMNEIGFDALTSGNHDYNYGSDRLLELAGMASFPVLGANVYKANGERFLEPYVIKEVGGLSIAIFGLATPETLYKTHPNNVKGLTFADPVAEAQQMVDELSGRADIIIALSHLGLDASSRDTSLKVAEQVPGIDIIIDGHSHTLLENGLVEGDTLIAQTGEYGEHIGVIELTIEEGRLSGKQARLVTREEAESIVPDPAVLDIINEVKTEQEEVLSEVVGMTAVDLNGERDYVRTGETNLGNLITDAMLDETGADVAITNGGGIRASIPAGDITIGQVITVLPFGNYIQTKYVTGAQLKAALEHGVGSYPDSLGAFPHVAGMKFKFDAGKPKGERVHSVMIKGTPLDVKKSYLLATNDFMAAGGDAYDMLGAPPIVNDYSSLEEALIRYIQKVGRVNAKVEGRIVVDAFAPKQPPVSKPAPAKPVTEKPVQEQPVKTYTVKKGDTLWKIAKMHNTTWQKLQKINKIKNPDRIYPGQKIILP
ncbi:5'-nucleotidase C-terminal domain-containing protein [Paenibacillus abyssi]|uniref:Metallophosphatase n=1 Tax=Paenibacillus abyssi TaxID=1340531 RepID=A0A917G6G8_9BACL|nr:5'-nucleotidase C-terminal domain-containing protein [Paenibacillus abyssi]GGG25298.1 metallophosphatase [Paenibacillus abyssi]